MYHTFDKFVDWLCYIPEMYLLWNTPYRVLGLCLLIWRCIGQIEFYLNSERSTWKFILFPNIFEVVYLWLVAAPLEHISDALDPSTYWMIGGVLLGIKMAQEVWLHALWPWYLKRYGFPKCIVGLGYHNVGY